MTDLFPEAPRCVSVPPDAILLRCAGSHPSSAVAPQFPGRGSHLERYARLLPAVQPNPSFYRPHRPAAYARWRDSVPASFRFSVKLPREITHIRRLHDVRREIDDFFDAASNLGDRFGCLLVQM